MNRMYERLKVLFYTVPEERFQHLLRLILIYERIPDKYLASFLGITPSLLSRIKKKD